jgi:2-polyprenyl-3-methyl-5-hydroxy-6-metoxy-1,4-benzoquinol methylase
MNIHYEELDDVRRYLDREKDVGLEGREIQFRNILRAVRRYKTVDADTKMIEVGTGTGWFPLLCQLNGVPCEGLEISPQLVQCANEMAAKHNLKSTIRLGNLEDTDLGQDRYDIIIASNVFEHVEDWRGGVHKVARALKPGGLMYFESTNKFSITSGEYSGFPTYYCYGWLPDSWRYALRKKVHGEDIMKLGIDFHQFRHSLLRREFEKAGFRQILDRIQAASEDAISTGFRKQVVRWARQFPPAKALALTFCEATRFICLK